MKGERIMSYERGINVTVRDLRECLEGLPDDMNVIIPVCEEHNENVILGYCHARTIGVLTNPYEKEPALCIAITRDGADMYSLMDYNPSGTKCVKQLF